MPLRSKDSEKEERQAKARAELEEQAKLVVSGALPAMLNACLAFFGSPNGMEDVSGLDIWFYSLF